MNLDKSIVLITGSSHGIGKETAIQCAQKGAHVIATYCNDAEAGAAVKAQCEEYTTAECVQLDVSDYTSTERCVQFLQEQYGYLDVLINNAGVAVWQQLPEQTLKEIDQQIDSNLRGLMYMTQAAYPLLEAADNAVIVNIGSGAGKTGFSHLPIYCATKFGVRGFTQALAAGLPNHMRAYTVNPGMTETRMTNWQGDDPAAVATVVVDTAEETLHKQSGDDVDVWERIR